MKDNFLFSPDFSHFLALRSDLEMFCTENCLITKRSSPRFLCFSIVGLEPKLLERAVESGAKSSAFQDGVQLAVVAGAECRVGFKAEFSVHIVVKANILVQLTQKST